jgi:hypothetical protein
MSKKVHLAPLIANRVGFVTYMIVLCQLDKPVVRDLE